MSRGRGSSSEDENSHWFGNYIMATHGEKAIQILMWQFHKNKLPRGVQRTKHSAKLNSWSQVFVSLPSHTFSSSSAHNTPIIYSVSKQLKDQDWVFFYIMTQLEQQNTPGRVITESPVCPSPCSTGTGSQGCVLVCAQSPQGACGPSCHCLTRKTITTTERQPSRCWDCESSLTTT